MKGQKSVGCRDSRLQELFQRLFCPINLALRDRVIAENIPYAAAVTLRERVTRSSLLSVVLSSLPHFGRDSSLLRDFISI